MPETDFTLPDHDSPEYQAMMVGTVEERKAARAVYFAPVTEPVEIVAAYEREMAAAEARRWVREELTPGELRVEVERLQQRVDVLNTYPGGPRRDAAISFYQVELEHCLAHLRRLIAAGVRRTEPAKPDFYRARLADLVGLAETLGYHPRKAGHNYLMSCPWHGSDREPSLFIYPPGRGWHCFGCGLGGADAASFAAQHFGCSQVEGLRHVENLCDI